MAGIGFRLQKLLSGDTYTSTLKAYAYSSLIAAGPFLLTVLVVAGMHMASLENLPPEEQAYLKSLITYGFAFSILGTALSQLVVTRHVADEYYRGHTSHFTAVLLRSFCLHALVAGGAALAFAAGLSVGWPVKASFVLQVLFACGTWLSLIFLSAAKDYKRMSLSFLAGSVLSFALTVWLGRRHGLPGYYAGFAAGQGLTFLLLAAAVVREFGTQEWRASLWLGYFRRHPKLAAIGLLYALGLWVDKALFWASSDGIWLDRGLRHCPVYDVPLFFAYLTVIPAMAYFLMQMETEFFVRYQAYYRAIQRQETLQGLERRRLDILRSLGDSLRRLILIQGAVTAAALVAVPYIVGFMRMDPLQMGVFRIGIFASFLQAGFLIVLNLLLYFDFQTEALLCSAVFFVTNALATAAIILGRIPAAYGYGYALACLLALGLAVALLNERLARLHYWTFVRQPIPRPVLVFEEEDAAEPEQAPIA